MLELSSRGLARGNWSVLTGNPADFGKFQPVMTNFFWSNADLYRVVEFFTSSDGEMA
jgi:hypothetical protein